MEFDAIDSLDFKDRFGKIRTVYGCSIRGAAEFVSRLDSLQQILSTADVRETIGGLYLKDESFAYAVDRCLELNGIDPDWVNEGILIALLFAYKEGPGLLIRLNQPENPATETDTKSTVDDLIASLWSHTQDLEKAIKLATEYPAKQIVGAMEAKAAIAEEALAQTDPREYHRRKYNRFRRQQQKMSQSQQDTGLDTSAMGGFGDLFKVMAMSQGESR